MCNLLFLSPVNLKTTKYFFNIGFLQFHRGGTMETSQVTVVISRARNLLIIRANIIQLWSGKINVCVAPTLKS